ncbi:uncharacterized protein BXZ73DRAFT_50736 [Epithele typhae]|uniref:uncharacterized protein n=1 Tax=Epithele typhae TaxID=378194 RepID=UPI002008D855|nr:uncharacterized protein BXZ73DRAFT_50736 [Epithele typhae]KAH9924004.1 hypothetical protein BXZ73DRAFT_50736 [Epithele typhae]
MSDTKTRYSVPKLISNGSNWVVYKDKFLAVSGAKVLTRFIDGTVRKPPRPIPFTCVNLHIPPSTTTPAGGASPPPMTDMYSHLDDDMYFKFAETVDKNYDAWVQKEADARALLYESIPDDVYINVRSQPTTAEA